MAVKKLRILHTNDLHSQLENWPSVTAWLKDRKKQAKINGEDVLLFDIGDHADRAHPVTEGLHGTGNVTLLNELEYDAVTIGNNEGMTLPKAELNRLYSNANFPVIVSNLFEPSGERPDWATPWRIITTPGGLRVGITGATVPFQLFYKTLGWKVEYPLEELSRIAKELKPETDLLICLSHLGLSEDEQLAEQIPEFDLVLGAHTHHVLPDGKKINSTWINQCGRGGKYAGEVKINIYNEGNRQSKADIYKVTTEKMNLNHRDDKTDKLISELAVQADRNMSKKIIDLPESLNSDWYSPASLATLLAEGLTEWCDAEISMVNAGVLLDGLPEGLVTYKDIHRICPHPINPAAVRISGEKLLEIIRQARKKEMVEFALKGFGFRGKILGAMVFDKIEVPENKSYISEEDVFINGEKLSRSRKYKLATLDMFTFGHLYPAISSITEKEYYMPEFLRDVLIWKLKEQYPEPE
ncbi:bifunctional metallophosphatase/5'-nucleotidase [Evansella clarkii]|uniref:bifunctional metallophosphatase/5'-nucleotidase n=1 Tax=Evansella clarkii TaxID=79879 RepID=UPI000B44AA13|nr:bifunctional UDP-sugar hydrolase/5'-nucleotidase [Evansella clarkii]